LGIITCGVLIRLLRPVFLSRIGEWTTGRWFKARKDWDETRILQPFLSHAAFLHTQGRALVGTRDNAVARIKKPLVLRVNRYPINVAENNIYISSQVIDRLLTKEPR